MTATLRRDLNLTELRSLYPYSFAAHDWLLERSVDLANVLWLYARDGLPHELLAMLLKTFGDKRAKEVGEDTHLVTKPQWWDEGIYVQGFSLTCSAPVGVIFQARHDAHHPWADIVRLDWNSLLPVRFRIGGDQGLIVPANGEIRFRFLNEVAWVEFWIELTWGRPEPSQIWNAVISRQALYKRTLALFDEVTLRLENRVSLLNWHDDHHAAEDVLYRGMVAPGWKSNNTTPPNVTSNPLTRFIDAWQIVAAPDFFLATNDPSPLRSAYEAFRTSENVLASRRRRP